MNAGYGVGALLGGLVVAGGGFALLRRFDAPAPSATLEADGSPVAPLHAPASPSHGLAILAGYAALLCGLSAAAVGAIILFV